MAPGETGDVLLTSLRNHATPLIRYRVGDRATAPNDAQCRCGRGLPLFGTIAGRTRDFLRARDGSLVGPREVIDAVLPAMQSVIDLQVIQDAQARITVRVVQRDSSRAEVDRDNIATTVRALVQSSEPPSVERVDQIALTPGGKLRTVVSEMES